MRAEKSVNLINYLQDGNQDFMKSNSTKLKFRTLCPPLPLANRIKEGLPRLILDRLPEDLDFTETGWCKLRDSQGAFLSWGCIDPANNAMHLISGSEDDPSVDLVSRFENALNKRSAKEISKTKINLVTGQ